MSHITLAASANAFSEIFSAAEKNFSFSKSDTVSWGPFSATYSIACHLNGGTVTLNNNNTVEISNVQIIWTSLKVQVCFNLPQYCVGGFCLIPNFTGGCLVHAPKLCIGGPICIGPDFSGLVSLIQDVQAGLNAVYYVSPQRTPGQSDLDAEFANHSNMWQIFLNPTYVDVQPVDLPANFNNIILPLIEQAIDDTFLNGLPGWAQNLLWQIIGPVLDLFQGIFSSPPAVWFANLLDNIFGLVPLIETAVSQYFASQYPLHQFEDPYPIMPGSAAAGSLIPVKIPIRNLAATVNSSEMVVTADVGPAL